MQSFKDFSLRAEILKALDGLNFTQPTEIQAKAIPALIDTKIDFHGQAQTGTGKTLAFGIPLLNSLDFSSRQVQALIVAPTRELVLQTCQSLRQVAQFMDVGILPIYGGVSMQEQISSLKRGVHIVVGTPGRLNDHLRRKTLSLKNLQTLVLDEADIMLDMGFKEEVDEILAHTPAQRNIWLFSATVKPGISTIMHQHMKNPVSVRVSKQNIGAGTTKQHFCVVPMRDRMAALCRFIDSIPSFYGFIFCQTKLLTAEVAEKLMQRGYKVNALHGDMSQVQRNRVIKQFKNREFTILVATDVAARGIDISDLTHVVNYSLPEDQESYVHRIGRTGRAGKQGTAITFVSSSELRYVNSLQRKFSIVISPLEVPTADAITQVRVDEAAEYLVTACHHKDHSTSYGTKLLELAREYSQEDLSYAVATLIEEKFFKGMQEDKNIDFASPTNFKVQDHDDAWQEIIINGGSDDGITKDDIINAMITHTGLSESSLAKVKVIKRRSFVVVPHDKVSVALDGLRGKEIAGFKIRASLNTESNEGRDMQKQSYNSGSRQRNNRPFKRNSYR